VAGGIKPLFAPRFSLKTSCALETIFPTGKALLKLNKTFQVANQEFCFLAKSERRIAKTVLSPVESVFGNHSPLREIGALNGTHGEVHQDGT
jgi:hypothetical protein